MTANPEHREALRAFLENTGMGQAELGRYLGHDRLAINRWLTDRPDAREVPQYARAFMAAYLLLSPSARAKLAKEFQPPRKSRRPAEPADA